MSDKQEGIFGKIYQEKIAELVQNTRKSSSHSMAVSEVKAQTNLAIDLKNWHHPPEIFKSENDWFWDLIVTFQHVNFFNLLSPKVK
jgi:hypothetical protein